MGKLFRNNQNKSWILLPTIVLVLLFVFSSIAPLVLAQDNNPSYNNDSKPIFQRIISAVVAPFSSSVLAQDSNNPSAPTKPNIFQQIFSILTAPIRFLFGNSNPPTPPAADTSQPTPSPATSPTPLPNSSSSSSSQNSNSGPTINATAPTIKTANITSLSSGTTFIDLIGKAIIDSSGNIYPSSSALTQSTKPTLGTSANRFYGIYGNNFSIPVGGVSSGIVKADSSGAFSAGKVDLTGDITNTLGIGNGGTGQTSYSTGDIVYSNTTNSLGRLAIGSANQILTISGGIPVWTTGSTTTCPTCIVSNPTGAQNINAAGGSTISFTVGGLLGVDTSNLRVGIGTTAPIARTQVQGAGTGTGLTFLTTGSTNVQGLAALDNGNVGIGTTVPGSQLAVIGNVGIGTSAAGSNLDVSGNGVIGWGTTSIAGPSNGLGINGNVGIGTTTANSALFINGGESIGSQYNLAAPTNGLLVQGNVGIGTSITTAQFQVNAGSSAVVVTSTGNVGIGVTTPQALFHISSSSNPYAFLVTSGGNVGIGTSSTGQPLTVGTAGTNGNGAFVSAGGTWTNGSSRDFKDNIQAVDIFDILKKVDQLQISQWNYKVEDPSIKHLGPIAEDFYSMFGLGNDNKHISTIDPAGVALASIQALSNRITGLELKEVSSSTATSTNVGVGTSSPTSSLTSSSNGLDINTVAKLSADGGLIITKSIELQAHSLFDDVVEFIANVIFRGNVSFLGRATFNKDTAGLAIVKQGADSVDISFSKGYDQTPFVNVTPTMYKGNDGSGQSLLTGDVRFIVQNLSTSGFTIKLNKAAPADLNFSWTALAVTNANQFSSSSQTVVSSPSPVSSSTPAPSVTPTPSPAASASPTPTPTATPSPSPVPSSTPAPSVTPTPSPAASASPTPTPTATPSPSPVPSP